MERIIRVSVDLAKNVMQIHAVDGTEYVVVRKAIRREHFPAGSPICSLASSPWKRAAPRITRPADCAHSDIKYDSFHRKLSRHTVKAAPR
jgi:hypothetical protein